MSRWRITRHEWDARYGSWEREAGEAPTALRAVLRAREMLRKQPPLRPYPHAFASCTIRREGREFPSISVQASGLYIYGNPERSGEPRFWRFWDLYDHWGVWGWVVEREDWTPLWGVRKRQVARAECALRGVLIARERLREDPAMDVSYTVRQPEGSPVRITVEREGLTVTWPRPEVDYKRRWPYIQRPGGLCVDRYFRKGDER